MNPIVRRVIILGTPLVLGILDLFHPTQFTAGTFAGIAPVLNWWITLHVLQLPLFCLLALSVYLLLDGVQGTLATLSKVSLGIFVIFYPTLDAILGLGTGALVKYAQGLGGLPQAVVAAGIDIYFTDSVTSLVATLGTFGWAMALLFAALALSRLTESSRPAIIRSAVIVTAVFITLTICYYEAGRSGVITTISVDWLARIVLLLAIALGLLVRPHLAPSLLVMAAFLLCEDHAPPFGPAAMACYFVAAVQLEFFPENDPLVEQDAAPAEQNVSSAKQDVTPVEEAVPTKDVSPTEDVIPVGQDVVPDLS